MLSRSSRDERNDLSFYINHLTTLLYYIAEGMYPLNIAKHKKPPQIKIKGNKTKKEVVSDLFFDLAPHIFSLSNHLQDDLKLLIEVKKLYDEKKEGLLKSK
ncbi:hypothetical protein SAMN06295967_114117 [Belliella buryatensis]|uniref:Uncharacterized protein n=1 Tax=Belliella buryatensis TaxID=1500549 RepID=A0A239G407_9BACT|nr:hypothetical protein SAMN06295967_114117 [Belliella buryatensis]